MDKLNTLLLRTSEFWLYLSQEQKDLIREGQYLLNNVIRNQAYHFKDYSFLVFPFAKAYEGFLKQLFKDNKMISRLDYISNHLRLGKLMSPNLVGRLGEKSLYKKIRDAAGEKTADRIWTVWKIGRNQIFHYFPHNVKAISLMEAEKIITEILDTMEDAFYKMRKSNF
ncbi:hypothetical protein H3C65_01585 [Patescibacteria group bacterium]|nr:hypothetical protein [Patescibacteria group bacterium]